MLTRVGWTRTELSRRLGYSQRTICRWYDGDSVAPAHVMRYLTAVMRAIEKEKLAD